MLLVIIAWIWMCLRVAGTPDEPQDDSTPFDD